MVAPVRNRSEALGRLADLAPHLLSRGVTSLRVFGSAGRDAMTDESDVDVLVEFDRPVGAFEFLDLQDELARMLGRPVDLVTPAVWNSTVLGEAVRGRAADGAAHEVPALGSALPFVELHGSRLGDPLLRNSGWQPRPRMRRSCASRRAGTATRSTWWPAVLGRVGAPAGGGGVVGVGIGG